MQTFTLSLGGWPRRLTARHPLVRGTDRIEALATLLLLLTALVAVPIAATAGTVMHDELIHRIATDRVSRHEVAATVTEDSTVIPEPFTASYFATVRWKFGGAVHTGELRTADWVKAGETRSVWIDREGNLVPAPMTESDAAMQAVFGALGLWLSAVGVSFASFLALRMWLNRWRHADWDRELRDLTPSGNRTNRNTYRDEM